MVVAAVVCSPLREMNEQDRNLVSVSFLHGKKQSDKKSEENDIGVQISIREINENFSTHTHAKTRESPKKEQHSLVVDQLPVPTAPFQVMQMASPDRTPPTQVESIPEQHVMSHEEQVYSVGEKRTSSVAGSGSHRSKRVRRGVERLTIDQPKGEDNQSENLPGMGTMLRHIPNVSYKLSKVTGKDEIVEALHNLMYRRKGLAQTRKKAVLDFTGLTFSNEQTTEKEIESRMNTLAKMKLELINEMLDVLDIRKGQGDKQAKMELLIEFLKEPKQLSEINLEQKAASKREKKKRLRSRESKGKVKKRNKMVTKAKDVKCSNAMKTIQTLSNDSADNLASDIPFGLIKDAIHNMLEAMTNEEFTSVTTKIIMTNLNTKFKCDMRPRKPEVKQIAEAYALKRLS